MREIKLTKQLHNYTKVYKDETKLFMVIKKDGYWRLYKAIEHHDDIINELRAWGYKEMNENWKFKTLDDVKTQIAEEFYDGIWFDDFQNNIRLDFLYGGE